MSRDNTYFLPIVSYRCGLVRLGRWIFTGSLAVLLPHSRRIPMRIHEGGPRRWHTTILGDPGAAD